MLAYALLSLFIINHALSTALRTVHALMAGSVSQEMTLSAADLGLFAGAYNVSFALMQLPVGVALDRYGPRITCAMGLLVTGFGAAISALAPSLDWLIVGQVIVGIGCAPFLMGGFVFASNWFPPERFGAISSVMIALGSIGIMVTATPLALLMDVVGWRGAFWVFTAAVLVMAVAIMLLTSDTPPGQNPQGKTDQSIWENARGVVRLLVDYRMLGLLMIGVMAYPIKLTIRSVWVGPYFTDIYGLDLITVGNIAFVLSLAVVVGPALAPIYQRFVSRLAVITFSVLGGGVLLLVFPWVSGNSYVVDMVLLSASILIFGSYVLIYASARDRFPPAYTGRVLASLNFSVFVGAALWQIATGSLLSLISADPAQPDLASYNIMYLLMGGLGVASGVVYLLTRPKPLPAHVDPPS